MPAAPAICLVVIDSPYSASSGRTASMIAARRSSAGMAAARFDEGAQEAGDIVRTLTE